MKPWSPLGYTRLSLEGSHQEKRKTSPARDEMLQVAAGDVGGSLTLKKMQQYQVNPNKVRGQQRVSFFQGSTKLDQSKVLNMKMASKPVPKLQNEIKNFNGTSRNLGLLASTSHSKSITLSQYISMSQRRSSKIKTSPRGTINLSINPIGPNTQRQNHNRSVNDPLAQVGSYKRVTNFMSLL